MKSAKIILTAVFAALAVSVASTRGQTLDLTGATLEGSLQNQELINSGTSLNDGTVSTWVVNDSAIDSKGYIFIYQLQNGGPDMITGVNFNNFGASQFSSSLSYSNVINGSLSGSLSPTVSLYPNFAFDTVTTGGAATFNMQGSDPGLGMGAASWFVVIDTDVSSFNTGYALTMDDFQAHGQILAPNYALYGVPEPSSAVLLLAGFACFYGILRFRRAME